MNREAKLDKLSSIIDDIADLSQKRHQLQIERRAIQDKIILTSAKIKIDIGMVKDDKGKSVYSNQRLRDAEHTVRLSDDPEFQSQRAEIQRIDDEIQSIIIEQTRLEGHKMLLMLELGIPPQAGDI